MGVAEVVEPEWSYSRPDSSISPSKASPPTGSERSRRGGIPFDDWRVRSLELDAQLEEMQADESVRPGPERERIDR